MKTRRKWLRWVIGVYLGTWILTWLIGIPAIDRTFDRKQATAISMSGQAEPTIRAEFTASPTMEWMRTAELPSGPWRLRSHGIAVAPFLILDEAAYIEAPLAAWAGRRLCVWLVIDYYEIPLKTYWVS